MRQVWGMWGGVLTAWALAIPVLVAGVRLVAWLRRGRPHALRNTLAEAGILCGTLPWIWMILTPTGGVREVSLIPLRDLYEILTDDPTQAVVQIGANLIVFLPLGFLLPLRLPRLASVPRMFTVGAILSALLEFAQYALDLGRVSSTDDVLMNAAGAALGAWLVGPAHRFASRAGIFRRFRAGGDDPCATGRVSAHSEDGAARAERERRARGDQEGVFVADADHIAHTVGDDQDRAVGREVLGAFE
ncbi:VanZ family protein [Nocardia sp. SYP-A9097]|uniref:VanZ family protein n=1 Tax=Nocardia sp. SYP-A9097 TaxID=2663237 RepID=UPI0028163225|nr:VanZ family protein [Nocardia sp. SYP-A9097]